MQIDEYPTSDILPEDPFWDLDLNLENPEEFKYLESIDIQNLKLISRKTRLLNDAIAHLEGEGGIFYKLLSDNKIQITIYYNDLRLLQEHMKILRPSYRYFVKLRLISNIFRLKGIKLKDTGFVYPNYPIDPTVESLARKISAQDFYNIFREALRRSVEETFSVEHFDYINPFMGLLEIILSDQELDFINDLYRSQLDNSRDEANKIINAINKKGIRIRINLSALKQEYNEEFHNALLYWIDKINALYTDNLIKVETSITHVYVEETNIHSRQLAVLIPGKANNKTITPTLPKKEG